MRPTPSEGNRRVGRRGHVHLPWEAGQNSPWADEGVRRWHHQDDAERLPHLACVEPVAKGRLRPGTVVWAHVPFEELDDEKTRPAVVHSVSGRNVTVLAGSASLSRQRFPRLYVELADLDRAGLRHPTGIRRSVLFTVDLSDVLQIVGRLSEADRRAVFEPLASVHRGRRRVEASALPPRPVADDG